MKKNRHSTAKNEKVPLFVKRAERAFRRVSRNVRKQNRALGMPIIVWENGKVVEKPA
jgi:hypothetical protein